MPNLKPRRAIHDAKSGKLVSHQIPYSKPLMLTHTTTIVRSATTPARALQEAKLSGRSTGACTEVLLVCFVAAADALDAGEHPLTPDKHTPLLQVAIGAERLPIGSKCSEKKGCLAGAFCNQQVDRLCYEICYATATR